MCNEKTANDVDEYLLRTKGLTRRQFSKLTAGMSMAAMALPKVAKAQRQNLKCVKRAMTGREQTRFCKKRGA